MKHTTRKLTGYFLSLLLAGFVFSSTVLAISLPQYRAKIISTKESLNVLIYSDQAKANAIANREISSNLLKKFQEIFPTGEKVEWQGASIEVDNSWILEKIEAVENEKNQVKRNAILSEISDRLSAIATKLDELQQAENSARSKDEDKQKLSEILRRSEYQKPEEKKENFLQQKWREFKEWLEGIFPRPKFGEPSAGGLQSVSYALQVIIFAIVLGLIGFLIYRFAPFLKARFKGREKKDKGVRVILGETLAENETSYNLFSEAEKLAREGNLRGAIRKGYIALLCELSDRKIIGLAQHKTNRDYLRDVRSVNELHQNMSGLTGSFERHWYGSDSTNETDWEEFRQKYKQTVKS